MLDFKSGMGNTTSRLTNSPTLKKYHATKADTITTIDTPSFVFLGIRNLIHGSNKVNIELLQSLLKISPCVITYHQNYKEGKKTLNFIDYIVFFLKTLEAYPQTYFVKDVLIKLQNILVELNPNLEGENLYPFDKTRAPYHYAQTLDTLKKYFPSDFDRSIMLGKLIESTQRVSSPAATKPASSSQVTSEDDAPEKEDYWTAHIGDPYFDRRRP